ncbi:hypothetical protein [Actinomadura bangladeshensis]|uniref:Uncharacterized protein n=1 Tax=Actinomadura bangladeshensis TaxID=453573 RepID=A0A6L9Q908_9ACTN|nr:hypothetical protein [Actinomadura bangladeshensis]NEA21542.1 hypothetical protein [Actinomadura bangladeshensis]NEA22502.1 hypothetical protein [Actinomadura bangladeshensis]
MKTQTAADVTPVMGADVIPGDRLWTGTGFTAEITHFVTPPAQSFACATWGQGVRIPFHGTQPIMWPIAPARLVGIKTRKAA